MLPRLHVITDEVLQDRFDHVTLGRLALEGGAGAVQYREKRPVEDRERLRVAEALAQLCEDHGALLVVDDRVDIAAAVGAAVHVGPRDLPPRVARALGPSTIGATANTLAMALADEVRPATYLGCGPVYGTTSKGADPPPTLGLDGLRTICAAVSVPVLAIGSLTPERVAAVRAAGAHGIAVLGGVCLAGDPAEATARYAAALQEAT